MSFYSQAACAVVFTCLSLSLQASQSAEHPHHNHTTVLPQMHAPIGVMGDHMHNKGEFMFSYRYMDMSMSGNIQGKKSISSDQIATTVPNRFAGMPMMPPTVRVVPEDMTTQMHMLGFMYAPSNNITLMLMLNYLEREMQLTTYQGMMGTNQLGEFETESSGLGDTKIGLLYKLHSGNVHHVHLNINWQIPTGDLDKTAEVLSPMNMLMNMRMPYAMQLGSGSHMAEVGITYNGYSNKSAWGSQALISTPLESNDEGYKVGKNIQLTAWYSHQLNKLLSSAFRLTYKKTNAIKGIDNKIMAPVTSANPANYGGEILNISLGLNTVLNNKHRIAFEYSMPLEQEVNGVQMEMDNMFTVGYQIAF